MPAETGAPEATEIEITPEMIEAGVSVFVEYDSPLNVPPMWWTTFTAR